MAIAGLGKVVALGGGTGLPVLLESIKPRPGDPFSRFSQVTAIVTATDDGGSSGRLRRDLGTLPPGDLRRCLVALSDAPEVLRNLFEYRFGAGELEGHSLGNLFIAALADISGDFSQAILQLHDILAIRGRIYPSTLESVCLVASFEGGEVVRGEAAIPRAGRPIKRLSLEPPNCRALSEACAALEEADLILLGPGSLFTSVLPNLLVPDLAEAVRSSRARKVYVCNLVTQAGETLGFTASRHVSVLLDHCGEGILDTVLCNGARFSADLIRAYARTGAEPVPIDMQELRRMNICVVEADLLARPSVHARHDPARLRDSLLSLARSAVEVA